MGRPPDRAEHGLVRILRGETVDEVDFRADCDGRTSRRVGDLFDDVRGRAGAIRRVDDVHRAFGMHDDFDARIRLACTLNLVDGEALVHRAEAFPQDHLRVGVHGRVFGTTGRLVRIPHWHLVKAHTHGKSGIAAKVLVWKNSTRLPRAKPIRARHAHWMMCRRCHRGVRRMLSVPRRSSYM